MRSTGKGKWRFSFGTSWGTFLGLRVPTVASIIESRVSLPIIATGGIRTGLDIAKSIALGASAASAALPFVGPALEGKNSVVRVLSRMLDEFRVAMFLCGCASIEDLRKAPVVITG